MEADISEPKSRAFNIYLRFFQLGLSLLIAILISKASAGDCVNSFYTIGQVCSIALIVINALAVLYLRCKANFPKI